MENRKSDQDSKATKTGRSGKVDNSTGGTKITSGGKSSSKSTSTKKV